MCVCVGCGGHCAVCVEIQVNSDSLITLRLCVGFSPVKLLFLSVNEGLAQKNT